MNNPTWRAKSKAPSTTMSMPELREAALRRGCTVAQFQNAIELAGENPNAVARYLVRKSLVPANFGESRADDVT